MGGVFVVLLVWLAVSGLIGAAIGNTKGRATAGFFLGLIGFIGWIVAALLPRSPENEARRQLAITEHTRNLESKMVDSFASDGESEVVYSMSTWTPEQTANVLAQLDADNITYSIEGDDELVVDKRHELLVDQTVTATTGDVVAATNDSEVE